MHGERGKGVEGARPRLVIIDEMRVTDNGDGSETVSFANIEADPRFAGSGSGFIRLKVALDAAGVKAPPATPFGHR